MPIYSAKLNVQLLSETFIQSDIENIVISPGSRNGALIMQFVNDHRFHCYSIVDERSAAYVALGMAQKTGKPAVVCCTSGSAAANYYPAITEAFYQNVPLIILTADRPEHYTDLFDGQTIRQKKLFDKHCHCSVQLKESESDDSITDNFLEIKAAIHAAMSNAGPVHINMPFSEPLYEKTDKKLINFDKLTLPQPEKTEISWNALLQEHNEIEKIMVLVGMQAPNHELQSLVDTISKYENVIVLTETTSNLHSPNFIAQIDAVLRNIQKEEIPEYKPDLLITLGQNVISKKIKQFLRNNSPKYHWHIDSYWHPNTYFCLSQKVKSNAVQFLDEFIDNTTSKKSNYRKIWLNKNQNNMISQAAFMQEIPWCDMFAFQEIIRNFPKAHDIHYSNSAVIRYSQLFSHQPANDVYCNRGTSGIDGSTSTAVGFAVKSDKPVILVTGDVSFFYDSNALWNNYMPNNFRIILVNNGGGNIFKIIPGPESTNALEKYFEAKHHLNASQLCLMHQISYTYVDNKEDLAKNWKTFYEEGGAPKLLEINTQKAQNAEILREFINL